MNWIDIFEKRPPQDEYILGYLDGWVFITRLLNSEDWSEHDSWDTGTNFKRPCYKGKENGKTKRAPSHWMPFPVGPEEIATKLNVATYEAFEALQRNNEI